MFQIGLSSRSSKKRVRRYSVRKAPCADSKMKNASSNFEVGRDVPIALAGQHLTAPSASGIFRPVGSQRHFTRRGRDVLASKKSVFANRCNPTIYKSSYWHDLWTNLASEFISQPGHTGMMDTASMAFALNRNRHLNLLRALGGDRPFGGASSASPDRVGLANGGVSHMPVREIPAQNFPVSFPFSGGATLREAPQPPWPNF